MDNNENTIRIQTQLTLREYVRLYCKHNYRKLCVDCMSGISGDVSGILRILQEEIDAHKSEK